MHRNPGLFAHEKLTSVEAETRMDTYEVHADILALCRRSVKSGIRAAIVVGSWACRHFVRVDDRYH